MSAEAIVSTNTPQSVVTLTNIVCDPATSDAKELYELDAAMQEFMRSLSKAMKEESETDPRRPSTEEPKIVREIDGTMRIVGETPEWLHYGSKRSLERHERMWVSGGPADLWQKKAYSVAKVKQQNGVEITIIEANVIADVEASCLRMLDKLAEQNKDK